MKQKLLLAAAAVMILALSVGGTMAYYTGSVRTENVITTGNVRIALREYTTDAQGQEIQFPADGVSGVVPGQAVAKRAFGENTGNSACYVRARVQTEIQSSTGSPLDPAVLLLDMNTGAWTAGGDGWYYCMTQTEPGEVTADLFTQVRFAPETGNEYQKAQARVTVFLQAVQSRNNGATALDAAGWPAD